MSNPVSAFFPARAATDADLFDQTNAFGQMAAEVKGIEAALINSGLATTHFADNETPAGVIDGVNVTFTLAHPPHPAASLQLFVQTETGNADKVTRLLHQGVDYTLVVATITVTTYTPDPSKNDALAVFYRY